MSRFSLHVCGLERSVFTSARARARNGSRDFRWRMRDRSPFLLFSNVRALVEVAGAVAGRLLAAACELLSRQMC